MVQKITFRTAICKLECQSSPTSSGATPRHAPWMRRVPHDSPHVGRQKPTPMLRQKARLTIAPLLRDAACGGHTWQTPRPFQVRQGPQRDDHCSAGALSPGSANFVSDWRCEPLRMNTVVPRAGCGTWSHEHALGCVERCEASSGHVGAFAVVIMEHLLLDLTPVSRAWSRNAPIANQHPIAPKHPITSWHSPSMASSWSGMPCRHLCLV